MKPLNFSAALIAVLALGACASKPPASGYTVNGNVSHSTTIYQGRAGQTCYQYEGMRVPTCYTAGAVK